MKLIRSKAETSIKSLNNVLNILELSEKGQVLILIVLALAVLLGFAGLGIDESIAYSDHRQAQNAADSAALAAAIAKTANQNYRDAAIFQISNNGYKNGVNATLTINNPPSDGSYSCDIHPDCKNYIQIKLKTTVKTSFVSVVGINQITNEVASVSMALKSTQEPFYSGAAIVALSPSACKAVSFTGRGNTVIDSSGIFVNSVCNNVSGNNPQNAFYFIGEGTLQASYVKIVGGAYVNPKKLNLDTPIASGVFSLPDINKAYIMPSPGCGGVGGVDPLNPTVATPGNYADFPPEGVTSMEPGIYCVDSLHIHDHLVGENILFVLRGGVNINGNAYVSLKGRTQGEFKGLLMYMLPAHAQNINIDGNTASEFVGLILAPRSQVTINGTGKSGHFIGQIVSDTIYFSGDKQMTIKYDQSAVYWPYTSPRVELVR